MKAVKATVTIGHLTIDGYRTDDGMFGMSLSELGLISGASKDKRHSSTNLTKKMKSKEAQKRFPQGFQTHEVSVLGTSVKLISIDDVPKATVAIGSNVTIDGLRLVDGTFAVSVSQFAALISIRQDHASRDFKAALGEGFQFDTCTSELHPKKVNVLSLSQVETLLTKYDRKGNVYAQNN